MTLRIEHELHRRAPDAPPVAATIGNFDGIHRGHGRILERTVAAARALGGEAVVVTFEPHPRCVLDPDHCPLTLATLGEKCDLIAGFGIDRLIILEFTHELSGLSAEAFCVNLVDSLALRRLVAGGSFALGHQRLGDLPFLRAFGQNHGFDFTAVEPVAGDTAVVSSTLVRRALLSGELGEANQLLGHPYFADATVVHGDKMGAALGYPTANLSVGANKCMPSRGVYATWLCVGGAWHMAATSIGFRPTFGGDHMTVEAFVLDFAGVLYGRRVRLAFIRRLREERIYPDAPSLVAQIAVDVEDTRSALERAPVSANLPTLLNSSIDP